MFSVAFCFRHPSCNASLELLANLYGKPSVQNPRSRLLTEIHILIVSDRRMAALHKEFCGITGATDVLTFQHGEIVISADTAATQARMFHTNVTAEIQLYVLHGLLHLAGFDDATPSKRRQMHQLQRKLMTTVLRSSR